MGVVTALDGGGGVMGDSYLVQERSCIYICYCIQQQPFFFMDILLWCTTWRVVERGSRGKRLHTISVAGKGVR